MKTNLFHLENVGLHESSSFGVRLLIIIALTLMAHFLVWLVRVGSAWIVTKSTAKKSPVGFVTQKPKFITLTGLAASALTFIIYSISLGFLLSAFGVDSQKFFATYLATASVLGLAVGFGSQGLVQDVVTGLTLIFSDTLDVGDMIEVSGQIGRVESVGLRFTEVTNFYNQQVFLPNRLIGNIARFPRGGMHAFADVQIPAEADRQKVTETIGQIAHGLWIQFSAIILSEPQLSEIERAAPDSWDYLRVQFKIWPGQGAMLETAFRQRVVQAMKTLDAHYADWMVSITYRATLKPRKANATSTSPKNFYHG